MGIPDANDVCSVHSVSIIMAKSSKAITKSCPACSKHVAVACKNCPCGHIFFVARRSSALMSKIKEEEKTSRVTAVPSPPAESSSTVDSAEQRGLSEINLIFTMPQNM